MEEMFMIYRDAETGKIWYRVGAHDPIEVDELFAKKMYPDIDSIPVINGQADKKAEKKVICPNCGNAVIKTAYCSECGAKLE